MARSRRTRAVLALMASAVLPLTFLSACGDDEPGAGENVVIDWWHNGTGDPLLSYWQGLADDFMASHPNVTINISAIQNEELQRTAIPAALQGGDPPELFQQWGGGELADQVKAGYLMDITDQVQEELDLVGGSAAGWSYEGRQYGLPFSMGISGFWYRKSLFEQAGITEAPSSVTELIGAINQLKAAGIAPIAVGAGSGWPAAHYWYWLALRNCSTETMQQAGVDFDFSDSCFVKAGEDLKTFIALNPFQEGFLATPAQEGATSSAGLLASGQAAMELMGHWHPGVVTGLSDTPDEVLADLGWFPFPAVPGGDGDPAAALGGGDGYSCSAQAPPECVEFLKYIVNVPNQTAFAETGAGLPVAAGAEAGVSDEVLADLLQFRNEASYVQLWLDVAYGGTVGGALNAAVVELFAGNADGQAVVDAITDAAATL
jgi:raffinose/stachyose/melibiose transport system substrate-binding protein